MGFPFLILGIIGRLIPVYFHGQYVVSNVLIGVGGVLLAIQALFILVVLWKMGD